MKLEDCNNDSARLAVVGFWRLATLVWGARGCGGGGGGGGRGGVLVWKTGVGER
jgi:hypothetical protein